MARKRGQPLKVREAMARCLIASRFRHSKIATSPPPSFKTIHRWQCGDRWGQADPVLSHVDFLIRRFPVALVVAMTACSGGAEGESPAPPCPYGGAVLRAHITELAGGCVGVTVDELVSAGVAMRRSDNSVLFDGIAEAGETVRGRLLSHYAYTHSFQLDEEVAVLVVNFDPDVGLQLLPLVEDVAQIKWGKRPVEATLAELAAPECPSLLMARYESNDGEGTARSHTGEPAPRVTCSP